MPISPMPLLPIGLTASVRLVEPVRLDRRDVGVRRDVVVGQVVVDAVARRRVQHALLVQRHAIPIVMPPRNWLRAVRGFRIRPAAYMPNSRAPAPRRCPRRPGPRRSARRTRAGRRFVLLLRPSSVLSSDGLARRPRAGAARGRRRCTAQPHEAVPDRAAGHRGRRQRRCPRSGCGPGRRGTPSASAAIWVRIGPGAGADVGGGHPRPRSGRPAARGPGRSTAAPSSGRWRRPRRCRSTRRPSRRRRGPRITVGPAEPAAPSRRQSTKCRLLNGRPVSGSTRGSLRMRSSIGSMPSCSASSSIARLQRRPCRAPRRGPASSAASARRAGPGGGWCAGSGRRTCAGWRPRSARRTRTAARSARPPRGRSRSGVPSRSAAEPDPLDRRRAVADQAEHRLAGQRQLAPAGRRPGRAIAASTAFGAGRALGAEAAADVLGDHVDPLGRQAEDGADRAGASPDGCWLESYSDQVVARPTARWWRAAPSGCCAAPGSR